MSQRVIHAAPLAWWREVDAHLVGNGYPPATHGEVREWYGLGMVSPGTAAEMIVCDRELRPCKDIKS